MWNYRAGTVCVYRLYYTWLFEILALSTSTFPTTCWFLGCSASELRVSANGLKEYASVIVTGFRPDRGEKAGSREKNPKAELKIKSGLPSLWREGPPEQGACRRQLGRSWLYRRDLYRTWVTGDFASLHNMAVGRGEKANTGLHW